MFLWNFNHLFGKQQKWNCFNVCLRQWQLLNFELDQYNFYCCTFYASSSPVIRMIAFVNHLSSKSTSFTSMVWWWKIWMCVNALRLFFVMTAYSLPNIKELRWFDYLILSNVKSRYIRMLRQAIILWVLNTGYSSSFRDSNKWSIIPWESWLQPTIIIYEIIYRNIERRLLKIEHAFSILQKRV